MAPRSGILAGRTAETAAMREALDATTKGAGHVVFVHGEAGIGKTSLMERADDLASQCGFLVLSGGAVPSGVGLPYYPVIEAFSTLLAQRTPDDLATALGSTAAWDLLARLDQNRALPEHPADDGLARSRLHAAFTTLLTSLAEEQPVALLLEDLHWADASSLTLLARVARCSRDARLLVVLSWRDPVPAGSPLADAVGELLRLPGSLDLPLEPLDEAALLDLLLHVAPALDPDRLRRLSSACGGNPFYAVALAEDRDQDRIPPRLAEVLRSAVAVTSEDARALLQVLATLGRPARYELVEVVTGFASERLDAVLAEVHGARLIELSDAGVALRHDLLADVVRAGIGPGRHRALHGAVAEGLRSRGDEEPVVAAELAHHLAAAGQVHAAAVASLEAARDAHRRLALAEAGLHLGAALRLGRTGDLAAPQSRLPLLLQAVDLARWRTEQMSEEAEWLKEAERLATASGSACDLVALECARGRLLWARGDAPGSLAAYRRALALLPSSTSRADRARVLAWLATGHLTMSLHEAARDTAMEALRLTAEDLATALTAGDPLEQITWPQGEAATHALHALISYAAASAWLGETAVALPALRHALEAACRLGDVDARSRAYGNLTFALAVACNWEETARVADEGLTWTRGIGIDTSGAAVLVNNRTSALVALGRWEEAAREASAALAETAPQGVALALHLTLAELASLRGDDIAGHLDAAAALPGATSDPQLVLYATCAKAEQALWRHDADRARGLLSAALSSPHMQDYAYATLRLAALLLRAEADLAQSARTPSARTELEEILSRVAITLDLAAAQPTTTAGNAAWLEIARAEAERARCAAGDHAAAQAQGWQAAAEAWATAGEVYPRAYSRFREGAALLSASQPRRALVALAEASVTAAQLGAGPLLRRCEETARVAGLGRELADAVTGSRPSAPACQPRNGFSPQLTLRERHVLEQLAQGSTNRIAARRLGISEKTVAVHLSNVYAKLGVTNRTEAVTVALRSGLIVTE